MLKQCLSGWLFRKVFILVTEDEIEHYSKCNIEFAIFELAYISPSLISFWKCTGSANSWNINQLQRKSETKNESVFSILDYNYHLLVSKLNQRRQSKFLLIPKRLKATFRLYFLYVEILLRLPETITWVR